MNLLLEKWLAGYMEEYNQTLKKISSDILIPVIEKLAQSCRTNKRIFVFGNGGSAANSSHFVNDLAKGVRDAVNMNVKAISLNENVSLMTAISNDYSYDEVYSNQLANLAEPGDVVFTMSVSGNSPNLIRAVEWAKKNGIYTMALVGRKRGKLFELADQTIVIDSFHYGHVEDLHLFVCHIITYAFMENPELLDDSIKGN